MSAHKVRKSRHGDGTTGSKKDGRKMNAWQPGAYKDVALLRTDPLGPIVDTISIEALLVDDEDVKIRDLQYVASYNWVQGHVPMIFVPGSPPAWTPPVTSQKLKSDDHKPFRDVNAARWPSYPLEPAVRSIAAMRPALDLSVDLVACSHTLVKLLDVARSAAEPFRFDIDVIGETVFFTRKGASPTEVIANLRGYGYRFPEVYTTWDTEVKNSQSHTRVTQFTLGDLNILLRSGVDAYLRPTSFEKGLTTSHQHVNYPIEVAIEKLAMDHHEVSHHKDLLVQAKGTLIPHDQTFEIKTRSVHYPLVLEAHLPRLWLSQVPNLLIAQHTSGLFEDPHVQSIRPELLDWETKNKHIISHFHALVKQIIDTVRDNDMKQCEVSWNEKGGDDVLITEQVGIRRRALPDDLHYLFVSEN